MKKRTYIVKIGVRLHSATTDREQAFLRAQQLEAQGKAVHVWSRPYRGSVDQLVEEDFWGDVGGEPPARPQAAPEPVTYTVLRDGVPLNVTQDKEKANKLRDYLVADGITADVVEEKRA